MKRKEETFAYPLYIELVEEPIAELFITAIIEDDYQHEEFHGFHNLMTYSIDLKNVSLHIQNTAIDITKKLTESQQDYLIDLINESYK